MSNYISQEISRKDGDEGFSLIELIVVVAILGILVAIAIPVYGNIQTTARHAAIQTSAANAATSVAASLAQGGSDYVAQPQGILDGNGELIVQATGTTLWTLDPQAVDPSFMDQVNTSTGDIFVAARNAEGDVAWAGTAMGSGFTPGA